MNDYGAFLRAHRKQRGLSQGELGRRAGVAQSIISDIESKGAMPRADTWAVLLAVLGYTVEPQPSAGLSAAQQHLQRVIALLSDDQAERLARLAEVLDQVPEVMLDGLILMAATKTAQPGKRPVAG